MTTIAPRAPLTRERILEGALDYIDEHGLAALSMHKLGAVLGVRGMSLYNHVTSKDDLLDGVLELLWSDIEAASPVSESWLDSARELARSMRAVVVAHPHAAPLITSRPFMPTAALRVVQAHISNAVNAGIAEERAYIVLQTLTTYALGSAFAEVSWGTGDPTRPVKQLLRPGTPEDLVGVAEVFCGQADPSAMFEFGLASMLRGLDGASCS